MAGRISNTGTSVRDSLIFHFEPGRKECYDRSGTSCKELSTYSNSGTLTGFTNQTIWDNDGSGSIVFDGSNDYINFGNAASPVRGTSQFTISYWVKKNSEVSDSMVGAWYHTGRNGFFIQWGGDGIIYFGNSAGGTNNNTASLSFTSGAWYHIVGVFDGSQSTNANKGKIYVNGQLLAQSASGLNTTTVDTYPAKFYIGALEGYSSYTGGKISLVQLYGRALSASEVLQNYNVQKIRFLPKVSDQNAQTFINAAFLYVNDQANAINNLVIDLKNAGLWTKMKAIYPVIGGSAFTHKFNLKDPRDADSAYRLLFTNASGGAWIHSSTGMTPNGTSDYADTFLTPSTTLTLYNNHLSFYSRTNTNVGGGTDMGGQWQQVSPQLAYTFYQFNGINSNGNAIGSISSADANRVIYTQTNPASFVVTSRTANNSLKSYTNGILKSTNTTVNTSIYNGLPQNKVFISAFNYYDGTTNSILNYSNKQCAFASIGDGLTDTEAANFYTIVQTYQTALGRQV